MTLSEYQTLTGITVSASDQTRVTAEITRSRRKLELMLGYTLDATQRETNYYQELGKTSTDFSCPIVDTDDLDPPDAVVDAYRLFDYNPRDTYMHIDPFTRINKVKLVYLLTGSGSNGVTVRTIDPDYIRVVQTGAWGKYLQEYNDYFRYGWYCNHSHQLQLAVDAEWGFTTIPNELNELIADFTTYYSDDNRDLKSESILTHSYTRNTKVDPFTLSVNQATISKYAGPNGTMARALVA